MTRQDLSLESKAWRPTPYPLGHNVLSILCCLTRHSTQQTPNGHHTDSRRTPERHQGHQGTDTRRRPNGQEMETHPIQKMTLQCFQHFMLPDGRSTRQTPNGHHTDSRRTPIGHPKDTEDTQGRHPTDTNGHSKDTGGRRK